jgi:hypothetical protein
MLKFSKRFRRNDSKKFIIAKNIVFKKFNFIRKYFHQSIKISK